MECRPLDALQYYRVLVGIGGSNPTLYVRKVGDLTLLRYVIGLHSSERHHSAGTGTQNSSKSSIPDE